MYELYKQENRAIDYIRVETILGILTFCLICYFQSLSVELNIAKMNIINVVFSAVLGFSVSLRFPISKSLVSVKR